METNQNKWGGGGGKARRVHHEPKSGPAICKDVAFIVIERADLTVDFAVRY